MQRYACPCCGYLTFDKEPGGTAMICPVCFWEDDALSPSASAVTRARDNFRRYGVAEPKDLEWVRPPRPDEIP